MPGGRAESSRQYDRALDGEVRLCLRLSFAELRGPHAEMVDAGKDAAIAIVVHAGERAWIYD
jgi:hypothetical protein